MKKFIIILIIIFVFPSSSYADNLFKPNNWDTIDKTLMASYLTSTAIDCIQTNYIFEHRNKYYERNDAIDYAVSKYGKTVIPIYFVAINTLRYVIANNLPNFYIPYGKGKYFKISCRKIFLVGVNIYQYDLINKNYKAGIKVRF